MYAVNKAENISEKSGVINYKNICQGVLRKFRYLQCQGVRRKFLYLQQKMEKEYYKPVTKRKQKRRSKKTNLARKSKETVGNLEIKSEESIERSSIIANADTGGTGMKCNKSAYKNDSDTSGNVRRQSSTSSREDLKKSQRKEKFQQEQTKLYNKLKNAALSSEMSSCDSDYETENKITDKLMNSNADGGNTNAKNIENNINDTDTPKSLYANARQASPKNFFVNNSPTCAKSFSDVSKNGRNKIKWPEQLLYLEMSHSEFDDGTQNDFHTCIPANEDEIKEVAAKKMRKRPVVDEELILEEETLESQIKQVRMTKLNVKKRRNSTNTQSKENEDSSSCKRKLESEDSLNCKRKLESEDSLNCKRKLEKRQNSDENINGSLLVHDVTGDSSLLDMSLPTPNPPRTVSAPLSFSPIAKDLDDEWSSDEDLPVGLTPLKIEKTLSENDIVWIKWKKWPHLPALVKKVYKKKRRVTCAVFNPSGYEEDFTLGFGNHSAVISYCDPKKDQIMAEAEKLCEDDKKFFRGSCAHAENFLTKEALKTLESTGNSKENVKKEEDSDSVKGNCEEKTKPVKKRRRTESTDKEDCRITKVERADGLSKQGQERIERMSRKTKPLTDFLISERTKEYLKNIYNGHKQSDLHDRFSSGTVRERAKMKHRGFGPIDDDDQIDLLLKTYMNWIKQINKKTIQDINYIFDVWVPEAIVFALKKMKGYSRKRAWEQFDKGVRRTKEELRIMHEDLIDGATSRKDFVFK